MDRVIFMIDPNDQLVEMREKSYDSEDLLQGFLATHPNLLAGDQIDRVHPRRWLLISREASVPDSIGTSGRWAVDHLFLDQDSVPTLVEVKRSSDTRIRREVVGQMLDYAANAVAFWPIDHLRAQFEANCQSSNLDPEEQLTNFLGIDYDTELFWQRAKTNLQAGKIRLIFIADEIPPELSRIVEFLNQQMDPAEVLAVEIKQYVGEAIRTLVPIVVGQTAEAQQRKGKTSGENRQWDELSFFDHLRSNCSSDEVEIARRIYDWIRERTNRVWWGKGKRAGSMVPILEHNGLDHQPFALWSSGGIELYFYWHARKPPFDNIEKQLELLRRLNRIDGISLSEDALNKRPSITFDVLLKDQSLRQFFDAFTWYLEEIKTS